ARTLRPPRGRVHERGREDDRLARLARARYGRRRGGERFFLRRARLWGGGCFGVHTRLDRVLLRVSARGGRARREREEKEEPPEHPLLYRSNLSPAITVIGWMVRGP